MRVFISLTCLALLTSPFGQTVPKNYKCVCFVSDDNSTAMCDGLNLTALPDCLPDSLQNLFFRNNHLANLTANTFVKLSSLYTLHLDNNGIEFVDDAAFNGLLRLTYLSLNSNKLYYPMSLGTDSFEPLKKLESLHLQANCDGVTVRHCQYPAVQVSKAPSIKHLALDGLPNATFGVGFGALKNLESLILGGGQGHFCDLQFLPQDIFQAFGSTPLSTLEINRCRFSSVQPNTFRGLWNLTNLRFVNSHLCGDGIKNVTIGLNTTKIRFLNLSNWCRTIKVPLTLGPEMFSGIQNTTLEYLDLSSNRIVYINPEATNNLPRSLQYISLAENFLGDVHFLINISRLENLQVLDMSYQNHYTTGRHIVHERLGLDPSGTSSTGYAYLRDWMHRILSERVDARVFEEVPSMESDYRIPLPVNIRKVFLNNIKLKYPVPSATFTTNNLTFMNLSSCMLTAFLGPWVGLDKLEVLDLSSNQFNLMNPNSFKYMSSLRTLLLADNKIGEHIDVDSKGDLFGSQVVLEYLDLSKNKLQMVPNMLFRSLRNLKYLSLADNALSNVSFICDAMVSLEKFDLSGNEITHLSDQTIASLDKISDNRMLELDLRNNSLLCNCQTQSFAKWLSSTKVNLSGKEGLKCMYENATLVHIRNLQGEILSSLQVQCMAWIILSASIGAFIFVFLVSTLVLVVYHRRWQIRYLYHMGRRNINPYHPIDDTYVDLDIDVYISFDDTCVITDSTSLREIVTSKLIPYLTSKGLRVLCREELTPGKTLNDVISNAIKKSAKVLTLLSSDYCKCFWNTFEFNMAAYEGMYTKRKVVIPVIVGDVSAAELHKEIATFIRGEHLPVLSLQSLNNVFEFICFEVQKDIQPQA